MEKSKNNKTVFVMMSGGVDSSVAAFLLQKENYNVIGCFIKGYNVDGCQEKEAEDARRVAEHLNIPFYVIDLENEYKELVVDYTVKSYREGLTPNPDVMCNKEIKFGLFLKKALELGADYVATGHYVRFSRIAFWKQHNFFPAKKFTSLSFRHPSFRSGTKLSELRDVPQDNPDSPLFLLYQAKDKNKDQSYFLWTLTQDQLRHCLFPIGNYLKSEIRKIAKRAGLSTAEKKDSQGICFLGKIPMEVFLKKFISPKKGKIVNLEGEKIGEHQGIYFYTIGQRHGLGVSGKKPYYIAEKNLKTNTIKVVEGADERNLYKKEILLADVNFINPTVASLIRANGRVDALVRIRYRQPLAHASLEYFSNPRKSASKSALIRVLFEDSQKAAAPGQSAVLYNKKGEMLGGGVITR